MLNPDFRDMLSIFNEENVEYLIIGAYALAAYGHPRATKDLDLWIQCSPENADRILRALQRFGAPLSELRREDFTDPGIAFQVGVAPRRIDLVTEIHGVAFAEAFPRRLTIEVDGITAAVISRDDLLTNKKAAARPQDLADVSWLESHT